MFALLVGGERARHDISERIAAFSGKEFHSLVRLFLTLVSWPLHLTVSSCLQNLAVQGCYDLLTQNEFLEILVKCQKITILEQMQCSLGKQYKKTWIDSTEFAFEEEKHPSFCWGFLLYQRELQENTRSVRKNYHKKGVCVFDNCWEDTTDMLESHASIPQYLQNYYFWIISIVFVLKDRHQVFKQTEENGIITKKDHQKFLSKTRTCFAKSSFSLI